jgi:hypothetical protein
MHFVSLHFCGRVIPLQRSPCTLTTDPGSKKREKKTIGCIFFIIIIMFNDFEIGTNQEHGIATTSTWWETRTFIHRNLDSRNIS